MHHNKLKKLPEALGKLTKLTSLNLSHNNLKELPLSLSSLNRLKTLDVRNNPKLTRLDKSLAQAKSLQTLELDPDLFVHPQPDVCREGTEAIMKLLCKGRTKVSMHIFSFETAKSAK